jgi:hypothetical protein
LLVVKVFKARRFLLLGTSTTATAKIAEREHPESIGSRRATPLRLFQHPPGHRVEAAGVEFIDENGGGPGVRSQKPTQ